MQILQTDFFSRQRDNDGGDNKAGEWHHRTTVSASMVKLGLNLSSSVVSTALSKSFVSLFFPYLPPFHPFLSSLFFLPFFLGRDRNRTQRDGDTCSTAPPHLKLPLPLQVRMAFIFIFSLILTQEGRLNT